MKDYYNSPYSKAYRMSTYFKEREKIISILLQGSVGKSVLDIGAGDAFWLKYFIDKLNIYTAIEEGTDNCDLIAKDFYSFEKKMHIVNADAFYFDYENIKADTLFFGFFISHFHLSAIIKLVHKISRSINFNRIIILDSYWSAYRKNKFINNELKLQRRIFNKEGNTIEIPKRFVSTEDLQDIASSVRMHFEIKHLDNYWCYALITNGV
jgi:hypothetical protein